MKNKKREEEWKKAKKLCRLSDDDLRMARELGMAPQSLIKNIPGPSQRWKAPVKARVRDLYEKKIEKSRSKGPQGFPEFPPGFSPVSEEPAPEWAFEDVRHDPDPAADGALTFEDDEWDEDRLDFSMPDPPSKAEIVEENEFSARRQREFCLAGEYVAAAFAAFDSVRKIALFGSVARPLAVEVPRIRRYRDARQPMLHRCKDVDLAVWVTDLSALPALRKASIHALDRLLKERGIGVAHHQVDVFVIEPDSDRYLGCLCRFNQCPKDKPECEVENCGAVKFLRQFGDFTLPREALAPGKPIILFERAPRLEG